MLRIKLLTIFTIILQTSVFVKAEGIIPVDTSLGAIIFKLEDNGTICHIWKPRGLFNTGDLTCKLSFTDSISKQLKDTTTKKFEFSEDGYDFVIERKVIENSLCYILRNGSTGAISCL
jgi:hypothetical protein